ncbi:hypothetical protein HZI73_21155 [Vallitalea pronyensis]|uniref:Uncharacterized protein n=1 Tax=Vallitalea pronyensis TaxID=1348613 RepID=A0A8J8SIP4_9FIRM|nr:hypothetical protein [Vallitalea pronyensis]QUI24659.1 hypothetical protein HZI73_21155 [Vallitalea pronyensis]
MINTNDNFKRIQMNEIRKFIKPTCDISLKEKHFKPPTPKEVMESMRSLNRSLLKIVHMDHIHVTSPDNLYTNDKLVAAYKKRKHGIESSITISVRV